MSHAPSGPYAEEPMTPAAEVDQEGIDASPGAEHVSNTQLALPALSGLWP